LDLRPLMNKGANFIDKAVEKIYDCNIEVNLKSDILTAFTFFTDMRDQNIAKKLFLKRRDLMIESPVYD
jgi:hypothetical protein